MSENEQNETVATPTTANAWKKQAVHEVVLPSSTRVKIKLPNLPAMLKSGQIPNELLAAVEKNENGERATVEDIEVMAQFNRFLVATAVVSPKIAPEDVDELPFEDVNMIVEFAMRRRDLDAVGRHISGLDKTAEWAEFRAELERSAGLLDGEGV